MLFDSVDANESEDRKRRVTSCDRLRDDVNESAKALAMLVSLNKAHIQLCAL
jgi:hypothetical protein